jgi:hypothetical protein
MPLPENKTHPNPECQQALTQLADLLCEWERITGQQSTLMLIPHQSNQRIMAYVNGRPQPADFDNFIPILRNAIYDRPEAILRIGYPEPAHNQELHNGRIIFRSSIEMKNSRMVPFKKSPYIFQAHFVFITQHTNKKRPPYRHIFCPTTHCHCLHFPAKPIFPQTRKFFMIFLYEKTPPTLILHKSMVNRTPLGVHFFVRY